MELHLYLTWPHQSQWIMTIHYSPVQFSITTSYVNFCWKDFSITYHSTTQRISFPYNTRCHFQSEQSNIHLETLKSSANVYNIYYVYSTGILYALYLQWVVHFTMPHTLCPHLYNYRSVQGIHIHECNKTCNGFRASKVIASTQQKFFKWRP